MKRKDLLVSKVCSRCGNDLMTGATVINLPYIKKYILLCGVCLRGLNPIFNLTNQPTKKEWKEFWNEVIKETELK